MRVLSLDLEILRSCSLLIDKWWMVPLMLVVMAIGGRVVHPSCRSCEMRISYFSWFSTKGGLPMGDFPSMYTTQEKVEAIVHLVESTKIAKWGEIFLFININNLWFVDVVHIYHICVG